MTRDDVPWTFGSDPSFIITLALWFSNCTNDLNSCLMIAIVLRTPFRDRHYATIPCGHYLEVTNKAPPRATPQDHWNY